MQNEISEKRGVFNTTVLSVFAIIVLFMISFIGSGHAAGNDKIKIGLVHSMSGGGAMYGQAAKTGAEIALSEINNGGGILGRQVELVVRDDKLSPQVGAREAKDLYLNESVFAVFGTVSSSVAAAISAYAKESKNLFIVQAATSPLLTEENGHRYIFRIAASITNLVASGAKVAANKWKDKKVIYIGPDYEYGHTFEELFWENYRKYVPDAVSIETLWPPLNTTDYSPYISIIMSSDAELVVSSLYGGGNLAFVKQAYPMGFFEKFHYYSGADGDVEVMEAIKKGTPAPIGGVAVARYPFWEPISEKSKAFAEKYKKASNSTPPYGAVNAYIIMYALKDAIEEAGTVDTEKVIDALEGEVFDTVLGKIEIRKCDHQAMMPAWVGITDFSDKLDFPHVTNLEKFENPYTIYNSCEEVENSRK
jgi:branched-chain amino acid transport system substrate-binding protein